MRQLDILCRCGEPLFEVDIGNSSYNRIECDNDQCGLFREGQGYREKGLQLVTVAQNKPSQKRKPSYKPWLREKKQRYDYARSLGFGPKKAGKLRSKSLEEIAKLAKKERLN